MHFNSYYIKHLLLIIVSICSIKCLGQTVLISEDINVRSDELYQIIGETDDYIYFFHDKSNKTNIHIYDSELRYIRSNELTFEKKRIIPFAINILDGNINFIYYFKDKGQAIMMARQYDSQMALLERDTIFVTERSEFTPRFAISESDDGSKVMIYTVEKNSTIFAHCFDLNSYGYLWYSEIETEGRLRDHFAEALVSNAGAGYFVMNKSPNGFRKQRLELDVIRFSKGLQKPVTFSVAIPEIKSVDEYIVYDNVNDYIVVSGLYGNKPNNRLNGLYALRISVLNPEKRIYQKYPFDKQLENEIIAEEKDKQEGVIDLEPVDIVLREDGGLVLISEIQKTQQRYGGLASADRGRNPGSRNWTDFFHEDLVMHALFPDGSQHWNLVLHKKQYSQDDNGVYSSYFLFKNRSAIRLFFNDEISSSSTVSEYIITGSGKSQRKSVMSTEYQKLRLRFTDAIQLDGKSFIVPGDSGSKMKLVKVAYE